MRLELQDILISQTMSVRLVLPVVIAAFRWEFLGGDALVWEREELHSPLKAAVGVPPS